MIGTEALVDHRSGKEKDVRSIPQELGVWANHRRVDINDIIICLDDDTMPWVDCGIVAIVFGISSFIGIPQKSSAVFIFFQDIFCSIECMIAIIPICLWHRYVTRFFY